MRKPQNDRNEITNVSKLQGFRLLYCHSNCFKQRTGQGSSEVRAKQCMNLQHGLHYWRLFESKRHVPPVSLKLKDSNIKIGWPNKSSHLFCRSRWCQPFCTLAVVCNHSSVKVEILLWSWHHHIPTAARLQSIGRGHPYVLIKLQEIGEFSYIYMNLLLGSDRLFIKPISCLGPASLPHLAQAIWLCRSCRWCQPIVQRDHRWGRNHLFPVCQSGHPPQSVLQLLTHTHWILTNNCSKIVAFQEPVWPWTCNPV